MNQNLLRPRPFSDLHFHFLAVGLEKDKVVFFNCDLNGITNDQSMAGITGMTSHPFAARRIDDVIYLHGKDRPPVARSFVELLVIRDIEELTCMEFMRCSARRHSDRCQYSNNQNVSHSIAPRINAFHHTSNP
jgi:hypothetical protein